MFQNILVCVDGTVHSDRALDEAIDIAEAGNGRLTVLTAIPRPSCWAYTPITASSAEPLADELRHEAEAALRAAVARVPQSTPVTTILSDKPIRDVLMENIKTGKFDLLVMGSRGRGALRSSVLGSVSHFALNHCGVPVLIIHSADPSPSPAQPSRSAEPETATGEAVPPGAAAVT
jgi:nucleotide-binding universal stress UspA family protein